MKHLVNNSGKVLLMSTLLTGMMVAGSAVAETLALGMDNDANSGAVRLASTDYKGIHPNKPHLVFERQHKKNKSTQAAEKSAAVMMDFKGRPPYNRHLVKKQQLERVQFARLDESTAVSEHSHSIYRGSQGKHPPYKRNW